MRRLLHQILSFLFATGLLIAIIGIPVNDHYCSGSYYTTTIGLPITDPCNDMPMENGCCNDETTLFSVTDVFNMPSVSFLLHSVAPVMLTCNYTECIKIVPPSITQPPLAVRSSPPAESRIFVKVRALLL